MQGWHTYFCNLRTKYLPINIKNTKNAKKIIISKFLVLLVIIQLKRDAESTFREKWKQRGRILRIVTRPLRLYSKNIIELAAAEQIS